jgi:predicted molibdopterin-dependent oxidoreductase YjgC
MPERVRLSVNGRVIEAEPGTSVLAALWNAGVRTVRSSVTGEGRGALCAMGTCHECRVTIDGAAHQRSCLEVVRGGMEVRTGG